MTTLDEEERSEGVGALTNQEAVALARAEGGVPATAHLVHIRSSPNGFHNANGRDRRWIVIFWNATNKVSYFGEENPFEVALRLAEKGIFPIGKRGKDLIYFSFASSKA